MRYRFWRYLPALLLTCVLGLALVACGATANAAPAGGFSDTPSAQTIAISADPSGRLAWDRAEYMANAGDVTFVVTLPAGIGHNLTIMGAGIAEQSKILSGGATHYLTLKNLAPGTYKIACTLPGHSEAGMVSTLTVR